MRHGVLASEPRSRIMAYFQICLSKYNFVYACVEEECRACLDTACESDT